MQQAEQSLGLVTSARVNEIPRARAQIGYHSELCSVSLLAADFVALAASVSLAFTLNQAFGYSSFVSPPYARAFENLSALGAAWHGWGSILVTVCLMVHFANRGHYTSRVPTWTMFGDVMVATVVALVCDEFLTMAIYGRPVQLESLSRWILFCPCVWVARTLTREALRACELWTLNTLVVAKPDDLDAATTALRSDTALGYEVGGTIHPDTVAALSERELLGFIQKQGFDFVVAAVSGTRHAETAAVIGSLRRIGIPIGLVPVLPGMPVAGFRRHYFLGNDLAMLVGKSNLAAPFNRLLKCAFDQVVAVILVVLFSPLMLTLALLVRRDGGPVFFRQSRVGAGGRMFRCIKFRTMHVDAEKQLKRVLVTDSAAAAEWAKTQKLSNDPRVTRIGLFLRRSSLDEMPQLFNVLRAEMSLVGPRPIVPAEIERYGGDIEYYYEARPGLTGLWQVSGRSDASYASRVKLDAWYVRNWTLQHDIAILFKTIPAVFLQRGAR